ncbi:MAG: DUF1559 domain-containing protein [Pirellulales bacterium]|nr:DUF1559 domain-containing protein [Pirellulales bacterium]
MTHKHRSGMTLVELLVVIFIMGLLLALLIPAVQSAREAMRRIECSNQLHQIILAIQSHEDIHHAIPTNGWGYQWVGNPDRGSGPRQPGGWAYCILPYVEHQNLRTLGQNLPEPRQKEALATLIQTPVKLFKCPTRGPVALFENDPRTSPINAAWTEFVARTDYAINEGDVHIKTNAGPRTLAEGDQPHYVWPDTSMATGVSYVRSRVSFGSVLDGLSNTYFVGEKYVFSADYLTIDDPGYDQSMYTGADLDTNRAAENLPAWDGLDMSHMPNNGARLFGSAHPNALNMAFGDGHVGRLNYNIDLQTHRNLGNRHDGQSTTSSF